MKAKAKVLVVDDDPHLRKTLTDILRLKGHDVLAVGSGAEAIAAAQGQAIGMALIDLGLPDMPGLEVMARIKEASPLTEAIILTGNASLDSAVEAVRKGAYSYLLKPYQMERLLLAIAHGLERQQAQTEIRRLSEAIRQSQEAVIVTDAELRFSYVNPAFTRLLGYALEDVEGQPVDLLAADIPGEPPSQRVAATAVEEGLFRGEVRRRAKDGRAVPVLLTAAPIRDEGGRIESYVGTMTDLSEVRQMEESLRESEEKFRSISTAAKDAVIMLDERGAVAFWNPAAEAIFGYGAAEVLGRDLHVLIAPERYQPAYLAGLAHFKTTGEGAAVGKTLELSALRKGGEEFPIEISLSAVRHRDCWQAIGIVRDISERKRVEAQLQAQMQELTRANQALQDLNDKLTQAQNQLLQSEKMASVGVLAAGVAHEINNPVGYVQSNLGTLQEYVGSFLMLLDAYERLEAHLSPQDAGLAELLTLKTNLDLPYLRQDVAALLRESQEGIDRVKKIVVDLKGFSRIDEAETWRGEDLHQGIESTLNVVWNELKYKCEVKKEYGELPLVECLLSQLNQVFMNLLVNAAQAIEKHGVITIRTGVEGSAVWIEIADTGKGIAPEHMSRLFDPFFTTKPVGTGTGLGLSVSYNIVEKHHGRIEAESTVGKGTTFRIRLPVKQPAPEALSQA